MKTTEKVTEVIDGDTFKTDGRRKAIRIAGYNAPEIGKPGANAAKQRLKNLILYKRVTIEVVATDVYGRSVANVWVNGKSVSDAMSGKR